MTRRYRTALVGAGRMGVSSSDDELTRRYYRYSSHADVLSGHPSFAWEAAVDPDASALTRVRSRWNIPHVAESLPALLARYEPEVLVIAAPPGRHADLVAANSPALKAVLCEKPIGADLAQARSLVEICECRGILLQVNLWRRCDRFSRRLASEFLAASVGRPLAVMGLYGNGLLNNGTHLVDFCRMLFGEVREVRVLGPPVRQGRLPLAGDFDVACTIGFESGLQAVLQPVDFDHYREVALDIWGEKGRLELLNEGLTSRLSRVAAHRALTGSREVAADEPQTLESTVGDALFEVYSNLAMALGGQAALASPGTSALRSTCVIDAIRAAAMSDTDRPHRVEY